MSSTNPAYGERGESWKPVAILGSGFAEGATVTWERAGVVDPKITVHSAVVVSSSRIDATISIAPDAELSLYDIGVMNANRKKGVGTEQFEVTTAVSIGTLGGNTAVLATNDLTEGVQAVGWTYVGSTQHGFYWPGPAGQMASLGAGVATTVSRDGKTIGGFVNGYAVLWILSGENWSRTDLPASAGSSGSRIHSMVSPVNGPPVLLAGSEKVKGKGNAQYNMPRIWRLSGATWQVTALSLPAGMVDGPIRSVNALGQAVGAGVYWDAAGVPTKLPGSPVATLAISADGTVATGIGPGGKGEEGVAIYWKRTVDAVSGYGPWGGPFTLPGGCARAIAIDNNNRIVAHGCPSSGRSVSAVFYPPYGESGMVKLNGTGNKSDGGTASAISPEGSLIGGRAVMGPADVGIIWRNALP